jgi:hypothetical protein
MDTTTGSGFSSYAKKETYLYEVLQQRYYDNEKIDGTKMQENALK